MESLLYKKESYDIIGACMTVHNELGCGFLEPVYQEALELEFKEKGIPFIREEKLEIYYREHTLQQYYIADFICYDKIIIELKALNSLDKTHVAQVLNYLKATDLSLGLLINFGAASLESKRVVL
ncbi:MAG: GxxExxY protein [Helicobacteraceae bacterium]|jgi:GxxExxY protein|nr:GxxExxY protein [Helicobacteraceae bacterium]